MERSGMREPAPEFPLAARAFIRATGAAAQPILRLQPAEPVVALVFPVAANVLVDHRKLDHVFRILKAELCRDADAQRETEAARQDLAVELHRQLSLRVERGRHVDRGEKAGGEAAIDGVGGKERAAA